jgi:hypothetical protein
MYPAPQAATHLRQQRLGLRQVRQATEDGQQADAQIPALLGILPEQAGQRLQQHGVPQQGARALGVAQQLCHCCYSCGFDSKVVFIQSLLQQRRQRWHRAVCRRVCRMQQGVYEAVIQG